MFAGSRTSGFIRFLHLLSTHPWREQALIVDPNAELAAADREIAVAAHSKVLPTSHVKSPLLVNMCIKERQRSVQDTNIDGWAVLS